MPDPVRGPQAQWADLARKYECGKLVAKFFQPRMIARAINALKGWK
ncbi:hypothetical protein [Shinella zoogloeoides]|nr:hypothetical protein [Shinella zoogloeoides]WLR94085.1 hypothetical protein Q9316_07860 [Shinella zoogloeoides]